MRSHVALLRGINVLGRNKVSMGDLRKLVADLGHQDVATYIQSGNVVFTAGAPHPDEASLAEALEGAVFARLALRPAVVVVSREHLKEVVHANPFGHVDDPKTLHAVFFREAPQAATADSIVAAIERALKKGSPDDARLVGRTMYLWTPDGFARSILRAELDRGGKLGSPMRAGTARNWTTVNTLVSLLEENVTR
jgi:uncharacterized protein (DUF1697 family)